MDIVELLKKEALQSQERAKVHLDKGKYSRAVYAYEHHLGISINKVLNILKKRQNHPIVVLDVMCEGGSTIRELNRNYGVSAFGVDILYYPEYRDSEYNDRFIVTPAEDLSMIPGESVDLVLNLNGYAEFSSSPSSLYKSIREALRVLCPGGELHSVPFISRGELTDSYCREGYRAIDEYEKETGQKLKYEATRRLLPLRNLVCSFFTSGYGSYPMITHMSPVLHLQKPKTPSKV